jgi:hypothetical protein
MRCGGRAWGCACQRRSLVAGRCGRRTGAWDAIANLETALTELEWTGPGRRSVMHQQMQRRRGAHSVPE